MGILVPTSVAGTSMSNRRESAAAWSMSPASAMTGLTLVTSSP
jgi:hypothetical protein